MLIRGKVGIKHQPISALPHFNSIQYICKGVKQGTHLACFDVLILQKSPNVVV